MAEAVLLQEKIRDVPDFPKKGILFKDITPLLKDPEAFKGAIEKMAEQIKGLSPKAVVGVESRGFLFGSALACHLGIGFIPVRKKGKLPWQTESVAYSLEYGEAELEIHKDAVEPGEDVVVVDDLLATGGTARATCQLIEKLGGRVAAVLFAIELSFLNGRKQLEGYPVHALMKY